MDKRQKLEETEAVTKEEEKEEEKEEVKKDFGSLPTEYGCGVTTQSHAMLHAIRFATYRHRDQRRKCAEGGHYIQHPLRVAPLCTLVVNEYRHDTTIMLAAILHDTIEDTDTTYEELVEEFGPRVADVVKELTDDKSLPYEVRKQLQIDHASEKSYEAKVVSMADKIANIEDLLMNDAIPVGWSAERVQTYCKWAQDVAKGLRGAYAGLDAYLEDLLKKEFRHPDGNMYPAIV